MTIDQLPSYTDYAATLPTPVIIFVVGVVVGFAAITTLFATMGKRISSPVATTLCVVGAIASLAISAFGLQASSDDLARFRAEAVSWHLDETYGIDVGFTENGIQPHTLDGSTVRDGDSVYTIAVATDGSILLVDDGGKEVPRVTR